MKDPSKLSSSSSSSSGQAAPHAFQKARHLLQQQTQNLFDNAENQLNLKDEREFEDFKRKQGLELRKRLPVGSLRMRQLTSELTK